MVGELYLPIRESDAFCWIALVPTDIGIQWANFQINDVQLLAQSVDEKWGRLLGKFGGTSAWVIQVVGGRGGAAEMLSECARLYDAGATGIFFRVGSQFAANIATRFHCNISRRDGERDRVWLCDFRYRELCLKQQKRRRVG